MAHLYIELWNDRPEWDELATEQREEFLMQMRAKWQSLQADGIELIGMAVNEKDVPHSAEYRYMAVWKMKDKAQIEKLEDAMDDSGWFGYFYKANARGEIVSLPELIEDMVSL